MHDPKGKVVSADEVRHFYMDHPTNWFLLEVQKIDEHGQAKQMRVVGYDRDKEVLREQLFDEMDRGHSKFIFVYANPDGTCDIG
jgi:hypothetical protein